jgi:fatty acid desaturase
VGTSATAMIRNAHIHSLALASAVLLVYSVFFFGVSLLAGGHFGLFGFVFLGFLILTPTIWGLVHEGIHGRLVRHPRANRMTARVLCVLLGFSFDTVQFGHLMHHRYSGHEHDRPDRMKPGEPGWMSWSRHFWHLLGGHYLFTALVSGVAFAPARLRESALQRAMPGRQPDMLAIRRAALKWFSDQDRIRRIRCDCTASALLIVLAAIYYGPFWPVLLCALWGRALVYSAFDNLPHYGMQGRGDEAAKNLTLHPWASFVVLNHNFHRLHHERPDLPWQALPGYLGKGATHGNYLLAVLRQFSGPTRS